MELFIKNTEKRLVKMLPEKITISEYETINVKRQEAILTEFEDKIAVGYVANIARRTFTIKSESSMSVSETNNSFGDYVTISKDSSLNDIVKAINGLVDKISSKIVGKDI